jgi:TonB family protein
MRGKTGALKLVPLPTTQRRGFPPSLILLVPILICTLWVSPADAQTVTATQTAKERKIVAHIAPEYPEALKRLYIGGVVHIKAVVAPNGTVESTELLGGNPILGQAAMKAVKQWKYSHADSQEALEVTIVFSAR